MVKKRKNIVKIAMIRSKKARRFIQIAAFGMFIFQLQNSIKKYYQNPVIIQESHLDFDEVEKPVIYVCQDDQFNYTKSLQHGYERKTHYIIGQIEKSNTMSWKGKHMKEHFHELQKYLFDHSYEDFKIDGYEHVGLSAMKSPESRDKFDPNYGYCKQLESTMMQLHIFTTKRSSIFIVDPKTDSKIRIKEMDNSRASLGPSQQNFFTSDNYEIKINLHDSHINDGVKCTDYERIGSSYGMCIQNLLENHLEDWYGCIPFWFPDVSENICEVNNSSVSISSQTLGEITDEFYRFLNGLDMKIFSKCLPPCLKMSLTMKNTAHLANRLKIAKIKLIFTHEVLVLTDMQAYDMFNVIVDLGSSLGLWLGLSVLGIFDILEEGYLAVKSKTYQYLYYIK